MKKFVFFIVLFFATSSFAQQFRIQPTGIKGSAGFGFVHFDITGDNPQKLDLNQGAYMSIGGEKGFDFLNLFLTISLNYLKTDGQAMYKYKNADGTYLSGALVNFDLNIFQAGLGLKFKVFGDSWFSPYVEGGGLFGFYQTQYKNANSSTITGPNTNYPTRDSIFDLGKYAEAGLEIAFSNTFGFKAALRQTWNKTKKVETLDNQEVSYRSQVYYISLLKSF